MATDDHDPESTALAGEGAVPESIPTRVAETDPVTVRQAVTALDPVTAVWESPGEPSLLAIGRERTVTGSGPERFESVKTGGQALLDAVEAAVLPEAGRPRLFGGFAFFDEPTLGPPWTGFEPAAVHLPTLQVILEPERALLVGLGSGATRERLDGAIAALEAVDQESRGDGPERGIVGGTGALRAERDGWIERVAAVTDRIAAGDLEKAVMAVALDVPLDRDLPLGAVLAALGSRYPACHRFSFVGEDGATFFGATPERLVTKRGRAVETEALAGTVGRGDTEAADAARIDHLRSDSTIAQEHQLVVDSIADTLRAAGGKVTVADRAVRTLANVHHLRTPIEARLPTDGHVLDLVELLHPTPAVGGVPPETAREAIRGIESIVRGWYGAPVGWFDATGDGTFAVGIRSAVARDRTATLFAGNGIVAGSEPETEWTELEAKFQPIREVLG